MRPSYTRVCRSSVLLRRGKLVKLKKPPPRQKKKKTCYLRILQRYKPPILLRTTSHLFLPLCLPSFFPALSAFPGKREGATGLRRVRHLMGRERRIDIAILEGPKLRFPLHEYHHHHHRPPPESISRLPSCALPLVPMSLFKKNESHLWEARPPRPQ